MTFADKLFETIWKEKPKGRRNEMRVIAAFAVRTDDVPDWFFEIKKATDRLEPAGIDMVIYTDMGKVYIQVKSCERKAHEFRLEQGKGKYRKDIAVIVVLEESHNPELVRQTVIFAATVEYTKLLVKVSARRGISFIPVQATASA